MMKMVQIQIVKINTMSKEHLNRYYIYIYNKIVSKMKKGEETDDIL